MQQTQKQVIDENQKMLADWLTEVRYNNQIGFYLAAYDRDGNIMIYRNSTTDTERLLLMLRAVAEKSDIDKN